jgi:hypothetical protein
MRVDGLSQRRRITAAVLLLSSSALAVACFSGDADRDAQACDGQPVIVFDGLQLAELELSPVIEVDEGASIMVTVTSEVDQGLFSGVVGPVVYLLPAGDQPATRTDADGITRYDDEPLTVTGVGKPATLSAQPGRYQLYSPRGVTLRVERCQGAS